MVTLVMVPHRRSVQISFQARSGEEGDDTLHGGVGNDRLFGQSGSDTLEFYALNGRSWHHDAGGQLVNAAST